MKILIDGSSFGQDRKLHEWLKDIPGVHIFTPCLPAFRYEELARTVSLVGPHLIVVFLKDRPLETPQNLALLSRGAKVWVIYKGAPPKLNIPLMKSGEQATRTWFRQMISDEQAAWRSSRNRSTSVDLRDARIARRKQRLKDDLKSAETMLEGLREVVRELTLSLKKQRKLVSAS